MLINLGSGQRPFASPWVNIDCEARWNPDIVADGASMPMFENDSADIIVLHHVLEHFGCGEADALVRECYRILRPRGSLIVCVPDMLELAKGWLRGRITDQVYMTNTYGAYMGAEADRHKWGYTARTLAEYLYSIADWATVKTFDHRAIPGASISADWWIASTEALK